MSRPSSGDTPPDEDKSGLGHRVTLAEASGRLGGHFLLAGLQPRRAQILDLLAWYERQLAKLGVDVRLNCYMEAADVVALAADTVILATGSLPPDTGFQKALPALETLPGIAKGGVFSIEAVTGRQARLGKRALVLDQGGGWRGGGTAWKLAEEGHVVTILTPDPFVGKELQRTTADVPLRRTLRKLGVDWRLEVSIAEWHGDGATILDHNSGEKSFLAADCLVLATTSVPANWLASELAATGIAFVEIGDSPRPGRRHAFFEGRKIALSL